MEEEVKEPIIRFNLYKAWPIIVAFLVLTIYIVKLEARVDDNQGQFSRYRDAKKDESKALVEKLDKMNSNINDIALGVADIQGQLKARK